MPPDKVRPPGGESEGAEDEAPDDGFSAASLCAAYAVVLFTPTGKYRRRVFLSLHSATLAVQRAKAKGQQAHLVLCKLEPVRADLELRSG